MPASISIHAPVKGATLRQSRLEMDRVDFNPRSREGSDAHRSAATAQANTFQSTLP